MSNYYESEVEPIIGNGFYEKPVKKIKKVKYQCNCCGYIDYLLNCPKCGGGMFKYKNKLG
jgi:rubrerythrin